MINWKALSRFLGISRPDYNLSKKELEQELDVQSTADGDVMGSDQLSKCTKLYSCMLLEGHEGKCNDSVPPTAFKHMYVKGIKGKSVLVPFEKLSHITRTEFSKGLNCPIITYDPHIMVNGGQCIICGTTHNYFSCNPRVPYEEDEGEQSPVEPLVADQPEAKPRPSWDEVWMRMAEVLAERSIDPRTKVGVLIVSGDNTRVLANGYNGLERGGSNVVESLEPGKSGCLHGEENALIKMDYSFSGRKVLYTTVACCDMCAKRVINGNVDEVVYRDAYRDMSGIERLKAAGIKVRQFKP